MMCGRLDPISYSHVLSSHGGGHDNSLSPPQASAPLGEGERSAQGLDSDGHSRASSPRTEPGEAEGEETWLRESGAASRGTGAGVQGCIPWQQLSHFAKIKASTSWTGCYVEPRD